MSDSNRTVHSLPPVCAAASIAPLAAASAAALVSALRARDPAVAAHSEAVGMLAVRVAGELSLDPVAVREVELTALLHDVGRLAVADGEMPGWRIDLREGEPATLRTHPEHSERLVRAMPGLWQIGPMVRAAHERWDGLGHPDGLRGEEIPLASRIVVACNAYDAIASEPGNHRPLPQSIVLAELADTVGSELCPTCAEALIAIVEGPFERLRRRRGRPF